MTVNVCLHRWQHDTIKLTIYSGHSTCSKLCVLVCEVCADLFISNKLLSDSWINQSRSHADSKDVHNYTVAVAVCCCWACQYIVQWYLDTNC